MKERSKKPHPDLITQAQFYDQRWETAQTSWHYLQLLRLSKIIEGFSVILHDSKNGSFDICELGCGTGWLSNEVSKFGSVTGVDLSPNGIRIAQARWPHVKFVCGDALKYSPETPFDIVVSSEVIEHVSNQTKYLRKVSAILRPGGYVVLTCPNRFAKRAVEKTTQADQPIELWLSRSDLISLVHVDFDVLFHETFVFDYAYTGIYRWTSAPKLLRAVNTLGLLHMYDGLRATFALGLHHILVARKREDDSGALHRSAGSTELTNTTA